MHLVLPVLYLADWVLFYKHSKVKWYIPLASAAIPLIYVGFVFIRAWFYKFDASVPLLYPYFFLNLETQHLEGVVKWVVILVMMFVVGGYVFLGIDKLIGKKRA